MNEQNLYLEMLDKLKPKRRYSIVATLMLVGMSHGPFEALSVGIPVSAKELAMGILGMGTVCFVWFVYFSSKKIYLKYKREVEAKR